MNILIGLSMAGIFFAAYCLMGRIDKYIEKEQYVIETKHGGKQYGVFGNTERADQLISFLKNQRLSVHPIRQITPLSHWEHCTELYALDGDDLENILICLLAARSGHFIRSLAVCNRPENKVLYEKYGITLIEPEGWQGQMAFIIERGMKAE